MTALLDVNVLIALAWPNHVHHDAARSWFVGQRTSGWATCALTEAGFVRVSCNPAVVGHTVPPADAVGLLRRLRHLETHAFWPLDRSVVELPAAILPRLQGYRQITDAVLLAAAIRHGGTLATFDSGFVHLVPKADRHALCVIPV
ncbi:MAG: PIN domain-containing protein [Alphaproteobacteria bacterium]|nr:PIN domain-containing protein [Alphaproteobacteria bacterium]